ncbi:MAG: ZIP family metal transporter [Patescibacteria group bacterium]|nr:ZIP family metal transporter [Patescibacteria group bacterium]
MITLPLIIIASLAVSLVALAGGFLFFQKKPLVHPTVFVGFAAGVMLTTALLELIPEAIHDAEEISHATAILPVFAGILFFFFLERFVLWFHHHDDTHAMKPTAPLILIGDGIHNFIDGIGIAAAFLLDIRLGIITTLAIAAHEIPQELADLGVLIHAGLRKTNALAYNFLSGLSALAGAILGYMVLEQMETILPMLLGFTGGMFLYISLSDLIPELHHSSAKTTQFRQTLPFIAGIIISFIMITTLGESH